MNIAGALSGIAIAGFGIQQMFAPTQNSTGRRRLTLWDSLMMVNLLPLAVKVAMDRQAALAADKMKSDEGHHTIPMYLCGAPVQELSWVPYAQHKMLHGGLSMMTVMIEMQGNLVDRMIPVRLGWRKKSTIMTLAEIKEGRAAIAGTIDSFYEWSNAKGWGTPRNIGDVFAAEQQKFVGIEFPSNSPCAKD